MSFPVSLSLSHVHEVFPSIPLDQRCMKTLELSDLERKILQAAEDNPLEYTLAEQHDAESYTQLLFQILDRIITISSRTNQIDRSNELSKAAFDGTLPLNEAERMFQVDPLGVLSHYAISKITDVIQSLKLRPKAAKVTMKSTFFSCGFLLETTWQPLLHVLQNKSFDAFTQSQYIRRYDR